MAQQYGRWRVVDSVGQGGQADVFIVTDTTGTLEGDFALKRLRNPGRLERFRREAAALKDLSHSGILRMVDADLEGPKPYLVTDLHGGGTLRNLPLADLSIRQKLNLVLRIAEAVAAAHKVGILHRDLKPENVFIRPSSLEPVVGDWGLTIVSEPDCRLTKTTEAIGSRYFAPPEYEDGFQETVDPAADVYSLGKLLYWMVAGRIFAREKHREPGFDLRATEPTSATFLTYEILDRSVVRDPAARFRDASQFVAALGRRLAILDRGGRAVNRDAPKPCLYCAAGQYRIVIDFGAQGSRTAEIHNFGLQAIGMPMLMVMVCDNCGNAQLFRPDFTDCVTNWGAGR